MLRRFVSEFLPTLLGFLVVVGSWLPAALHAERLVWSSTLGSINLRSNGATMQQDYAFELGVFTGGFIPTAANTAQWSAHWVPAQRIYYSDADYAFLGEFTVEDNEPPFTVGTNAYVWGFGGEGEIKEWILFRGTTWNWPAPDPFDPFPRRWNAHEANIVVLGSIFSTGSPYLMKSAAMVGNQPVISWSQWAATELASTPLNAPTDDPDQDGIANSLEFIYGTPPLAANPPTVNPIGWNVLGGVGFLQMTVPRRLDRSAQVVVEISSDLVTWNSGNEWTEIMENSAAALVVRDLTPYSEAIPKRFMRVRVNP